LRRIEKGLIAAILLLAVTISAFAVIESASACNPPPPPCPCEPGTVHYLGKDTTTKGNWKDAIGSPIGVYGSYAHILPNPPAYHIETPVGNFSVPVGSFTYKTYNWTNNQISGLPLNKTDPPYWDEYLSLLPPVTYFLTGNQRYIEGIGWIQIPVFEWAWDNFNSSDIRACYFTNESGVAGPGTRLTCWDDGAESTPFGSLSESHFNITMTFPEGAFMLSLYAYNEEGAGLYRDNQTIYVTDTSGKILATGTMKGTEFYEGMYLNFVVCGPTTIVVQVKKSPASLNALLSGIFVDKISCKYVKRCERTIGFWKTNIGKLGICTWGHPQLTWAQVYGYIGDASEMCPAIFGYLGSLTGNNRLRAAYQIFDYGRNTPLIQKVKAQFLGFLMNIASGKFSEWDIIGLSHPGYPFTIQQVMDLACQNILAGTNLSNTMTMLDTLNNGYTAIVLIPY
jgi:hypothetical protein